MVLAYCEGNESISELEFVVVVFNHWSKFEEFVDNSVGMEIVAKDSIVVGNLNKFYKITKKASCNHGNEIKLTPRRRPTPIRLRQCRILSKNRFQIFLHVS